MRRASANKGEAGDDAVAPNHKGKPLTVNPVVIEILIFIPSVGPDVITVAVDRQFVQRELKQLTNESPLLLGCPDNRDARRV
jgi:hypothetical protein